jgi:signal transduction histidine kinase
MGNLISALLTYGQVGGSTVRERKPVNLEDVLRLAMMNVTESIRASSAVITNDKLPTVNADPDQMTQLFQNFVGNSLKYRSLNEPPRIHISSEIKDGFWLISVQDNGEGFNPDEADVIFGAFKRLHGRDVPGTGIGLALCKRIVEHHGGRIRAESQGKGKGARFSFTLPVSK